MSEEKALGFRKTLYEDLRAMGVRRPSLFKLFTSLFLWPRFMAIFLYRCAASYSDKNALGKMGQRFFYLLNFTLTGCDISPNAKIGPGFRIPHPSGIVIGPAMIGSNVTIMQHVTIGRSAKDDQKNTEEITSMDDYPFPTIEDYATTYVGAVVLGDIRIGKRARIGANAVVLQDVPDYHLAVGIPARILPPKPEKAEPSLISPVVAA